MEPNTRSALVTGASSGIGLAYAEMLADEGFDLTVVARGAERLGEAATALRRHGVAVAEQPADLSDEEQIREVFAAHGAAYGSIDVLVNNAGAAHMAPASEITAGMIDVQLALERDGGSCWPTGRPSRCWPKERPITVRPWCSTWRRSRPGGGRR